MPHGGLSTNDDGLFNDQRKRVVIPIASEQLRLRLCVIAHAGLNSGHIGYHAAMKLLQQWVYWKGMEADLRVILVYTACRPGVAFGSHIHWVGRVKGHGLIR